MTAGTRRRHDANRRVLAAARLHNTHDYHGLATLIQYDDLTPGDLLSASNRMVVLLASLLGAAWGCSADAVFARVMAAETTCPCEGDDR